MTNQSRMDSPPEQFPSSQEASQRSPQPPKKSAIDFLLNSTNIIDTNNSSTFNFQTFPTKDADLENTFMRFLTNLGTPPPVKTNSSPSERNYQDHSTPYLDTSYHDNHSAKQKMLHTFISEQLEASLHPQPFADFPSHSSLVPNLQSSFPSFPTHRFQPADPKLPVRHFSAPNVGEGNFEPVSKKPRTSWNPELLDNNNNNSLKTSISEPSIDFVNNIHLPSTVERKEEGKVRLSRSQLSDEQWMKQFDDLQKFAQKFGHTNVTRTKPEWRALGNWVTEQRRKQRKGKLLQKRFEMLNSIGFEWDRSYYFKPLTQQQEDE